MSKPRANFDRMRHVGGKAPGPRQMRKEIRKLEKELALNPPRNPFGEWIHAVVGAAAIVRETRRADKLAEIDRDARDYVPPPPLAPGDFVIPARPFESSRAYWHVVACACGLCARGHHVAVDEARPDGSWQHLARCALRRRGEVSQARAEAWLAYTACKIDRVVQAADEKSHPVISALLEMAEADVRGRT
jgi:hypothetical protein